MLKIFLSKIQQKSSLIAKKFELCQGLAERADRFAIYKGIVSESFCLSLRMGKTIAWMPKNVSK